MEKPAVAVPPRLKPRKTPVQSRSGATVEAIHDAVIQVLLADGLMRLTTTRVAERAGVSVGTLYQYFPNKEALLFAVLQRHFEQLVDALEAIGSDNIERPLAERAMEIADAYVSVKIAHPEATTALYRVAGAIDQFRLSTDIFKRLESAIVRALVNTSDATFDDPARTAFTVLSALAGLSRGTFGKLVSGSDVLERFRDEARLLARAYLTGAANSRT